MTEKFIADTTEYVEPHKKDQYILWKNYGDKEHPTIVSLFAEVARIDPRSSLLLLRVLNQSENKVAHWRVSVEELGHGRVGELHAERLDSPHAKGQVGPKGSPEMGRVWRPSS